MTYSSLINIILFLFIPCFCLNIVVYSQPGDLPSGLRKPGAADSSILLGNPYLFDYLINSDLSLIETEKRSILSRELMPIDSTLLFRIKNLTLTKHLIQYKLTNTFRKDLNNIDWNPLGKRKLSAEDYFGTIMNNNLKYYGKYEVRPIDQGIRIPLGDIYNFFKGLLVK